MTYEPATGRFSATALLDTLRSDSPRSRNLALVQTAPGHWRAWGHFTDAVRAGTTQFDVALGSKDVWEYYEQYPEEGSQFGAAMTDLSTLPGARAQAERRGLDDRSSVVVGDFFEAVPTADMYLLKYIVHDWDDTPAFASCPLLAKRCRTHRGCSSSRCWLARSPRPGSAP
jgi:hypothetical protein